MDGRESHLFLKKLARTGHPLLAVIASFHLAARATAETPDVLTALLAKSRADATPGAVPGTLPGGRVPFAALRLGRVLPALAGDGLTDFREPWRRLALLPPDRLRRLADWYGLAALRDEVARSMKRDAVNRLRRRFGEEGRVFALRRAGLLFGARVPLPAEPDGGASLEDRIGRLGRRALLACLDADLRAALAPSLPPGFLRAPPGVSPLPVHQVWPVLRKLVIREIAPAWTPCFE